MAKLAVIRAQDVAPAVGYPVAGTTQGVRWAKLLSPPDYSLWAVQAELGDGATITWEGPHGDDGVYVCSGEVVVGDRSCPADGAVIVESDAYCTLRARGDTTILHCGSVDPEPPNDGPHGPATPEGHGVHVVGPAGWFSGNANPRSYARWFSDGTCPTCRAQLLHVRTGRSSGLAHSHSQDEIIHILEGAVRMGATEHGPGTSLCIPKDVRYALRDSGRGVAFLNFRRDISMMTADRDAPPYEEGGLIRGGELVGDLR